MKTLITVVVTIVALVALGLITIFTGIYDVSAANEHKGLTRWVMSTAMDCSVEHHAKGIEVPTLGDSVQVAMGFDHYNEMCVTCHGAPGVDRSETGQGLNPHAPNLSKSITDMSDEELYWVIKNGIKMTGMPSYGKTHTEEQLWAMVAFVKLLPGMTPDEYRQYIDTYGSHGDDDMDMDEHEHEE